MKEKIYPFPCDEQHASWGETLENRVWGAQTSCETSFSSFKTKSKKYQINAKLKASNLAALWELKEQMMYLTLHLKTNDSCFVLISVVLFRNARSYVEIQVWLKNGSEFSDTWNKINQKA